MLLASVFAIALAQGPQIPRDDYGVPHIKASTSAEAWREAGYAVAQDRLWQMEMSRRTVEGKMAEIMGPSYVASDKEARLAAYSDDELKAEIEKLPASLQESFTEYARGVNDFIAEGHLPPNYEKLGFKPEPWTPVDSAAIGVWMLHYFGRGGAGQIRNMAALAYLQGRKPLQGHVLDVLDDFMWQNDASSPTTVAKEDESPNHPTFAAPSRALTEAHLKLLPKLGLFDLLPGLSLAMREKSTRVAMKVGAPFKTGSYCMVVGGKRSATGMPALLSGPQMGFTDPSIVHEMSISTSDFQVIGADIPGIPGVVVGHTKYLAWGLTSGVGATDDFVYYTRVGDDQYKYGSETRPLGSRSMTIHVKGASDVTVVQQRTVDGLVVLSTKAHGDVPGIVFARHTSYEGKELGSFEAFSGLWTAKNAREADATAAKGTMSFNLFYATVQGDIGYRYAGLIPLRSPLLDPRLPTPGDPKYAWSGMIPTDQMPHVRNPKSGLLTNWNNKPVSWWPNLDTPVWGKIFRVDAIRRVLDKPKLAAQDFEQAAWTIARTDETWPFLGPYAVKAAESLAAEGAAHPEKNDNAPGLAMLALGGFEGRLLDGSRQAVVYRLFVSELRKALFLEATGNFASDATFEQAAQPSVMLAALEGRTKFNYLHGRKAADVCRTALLNAIHGSYSANGVPKRYVPGQIRVPGESAIPYSNRGTYIQVVELLPDGPLGRNVLPPGVAETGPHSRDQVPLSRAWVYKPMLRPW
ncbi:MAG TPA: penicillin acylase family protein [Fimbriimonas sp.]|nr:penicillin acylase family protein [Fimbriimonas sp.]